MDDDRRGFWTKMHRPREISRRRRTHNGLTGSPAHGFIDRCNQNWFLGGPMIQRFDDPIMMAFHYVLANKGGYRKIAQIPEIPISLKLNQLLHSRQPGGEKMRGEKMKVTSIMLLKKNASKMSETGLSIMLLKNKLLMVASPLC
jgi:hypothetical protein